MPPTLSVAMIVKNEALLLPECLKAIQAHADDCVVVDTGSTDDTMAIATNAHCKVSSYPWGNDFSAARNAALAQCTGDWILVLDADERIQPDDWQVLKKHIQSDTNACYRFVTRNYTDNIGLSDLTHCDAGDPWARGFPAWFPSEKVRLFPRHPDIRFENPVHELVNDSAVRAGFAIRDCDVPIHHYPLLKDARALKAKRRLYLRLGEEKIKLHPDKAHFHAELGHQHLELGQYVEALVAYQRALQLEPENGERLADLGGALYALGKTAQAAQAYTLALKLDATLQEAWRNLGVIHAGDGQWVNAEQCFAKAIDLCPNQAEAHRYHAIALQNLEQGKEALIAITRSVELNPASDEAQSLYQALKEQMKG